MLRFSRGAERQPSFGRRVEAIPKTQKTQKQNPKKSTNGILWLGTGWFREVETTVFDPASQFLSNISRRA